jgi:PKD repeat protein
MFSLQSWLRRWFGLSSARTRTRVAGRARRRSALRCPLRLEFLEDRSVPAAFNTAPALLDFAVTPSINEGDTVAATGRISDPDAGDAFALVINWGDGPSQTVNLPAGTTNFNVPHTYLDNPAGAPAGQFAVTASLTDDHGGAAAPGRILGPNAFGYSAYTQPAVSVSLAPGAPGVFVISDNDDDSFAAVDLGANTFRYYGTSYTGASSVFVATNGLVSLGGATGVIANDLNLTPPIAAIAPFGDDLVTFRNANDMVLGRFDDTNGDGTMDRLVIEWHDVQPFAGGTSGLTFQAILALNTGAASGDVILNYLDLDCGNGHSNAALASVGIRNSNDVGADVLQVKSANGFVDPNVAAGLSVLFSATPRPAGTASVTVNNVAPVQGDLSLSPATIDRGGSVTLSGSATDAGLADSLTATIDWGDGSTPQAVSVNPVTHAFSASHAYSATATADAYTVRVTVADDDGGASAEATATVHVNSQTAMVQPLTGPNAGVLGQFANFTGVRGQPLTFASSFTNADTVVWDFGDGTVVTTTGVPAGPVSAAHAYTTSGHYVVKLTVSNAGSSASVSTPIDITAVELQADPFGGTALVVGGTTGADTIVFDSVYCSPAIRLKINGVVQGTYTPTGRLIAYGQAGNDVLRVDDDIWRSAWLYGGAGDDRLRGGAGRDVLLGGAGNDIVRGGGGRDLLIGGTGVDWLTGDGSGDILIAGFTDRDDDPQALKQILDVWTAVGVGYQDRVQQLRSGLLAAGVVHDDGVVDVLTGDCGRDWFFASSADWVTDQTWWEQAEGI